MEIVISRSPFTIEIDAFVADCILTVNHISGYQNNYGISWGDGQIGSYINSTATHTYAAAGTYKVQLIGQVEGITFSSSLVASSPAIHLTKIISFGITLKTMTGLFSNLGKTGKILIPKCYSPDVASMYQAFIGWNAYGTWEIEQGAFELLTKCDFTRPFEIDKMAEKSSTYSSQGSDIYLQGSIFPKNTELPKMNLQKFFRNCTIMTPIPEDFLYNIESDVILDGMFAGAGCAYDLPARWLPKNLSSDSSMLDFMGYYSATDGGTAFQTPYDPNFVGNMEEVWKKSNLPIFNINTFNCPSLTNYENIPAEWGGAGYASVSFAEDSWEKINMNAQAGLAQDFYSVGDEKTIQLTTGEEVTLVILGFNHDTILGGGEVAPITIGMKNLLAEKYRINATSTNAGGWSDSEVRQTMELILFNQLPADLRAVIKYAYKKTTSGNGSTEIKYFSGKIWAFARVEIDGTAEEGYKDEGSQYEYWRTVKDGTVNADRIKYLANGGGEVMTWWLRSPETSSSTYFCNIATLGHISIGSAEAELGICFGFSI